ncbi:MAG: haloacid dehalogenase [Chloroflexi bacterium B3_Chlor]|nr:MAG: haloacid dehalogenase [Chloroflexi bacterium B3_Chlor]
MDELNDIAQKALEALERRHQSREKALGLSRRLIRHSANTIRAIHRGEFEKARGMLDEGRAVVEQFSTELADERGIYEAGYVQDALKEFAEASITYALITGQAVPGAQELSIDYPAYLNGLGEAMGELRRAILDLMRSGDLSKAEELLRTMDEVYGVLVSVDYPKAITRGLRRTTDMVRGVLERTRGDLTMAVRQQRLEHTLREFEDKVLDRYAQE